MLSGNNISVASCISYSFIRLFIHLCITSSTKLSTQPFIRLSFLHSSMHPSMNPLIHHLSFQLCNHPSIHSYKHPRLYPCIHLYKYPDNHHTTIRAITQTSTNTTINTTPRHPSIQPSTKQPMKQFSHPSVQGQRRQRGSVL